MIVERSLLGKNNTNYSSIGKSLTRHSNINVSNINSFCIYSIFIEEQLSNIGKPSYMHSYTVGSKRRS